MVKTKSLWTGVVQFGPLNMPVKLGSAVKDNKLGLHRVDPEDGTRLKMINVREDDGREVPWDKIAKGFDAPDGSTVVLTKEDFKTAYGEKNRIASVLMFTDAANIPPMSAKTSYWIQPDIGGEKPYRLIAEELQRAGKVAVVRFAMREREAIAVIRPQEGYLSLESLEFDMDMLRPDFAVPPDTASDAERELTRQFIGLATEKYDHSAQADTSSEALQAVITAKIGRGQVIQAPSRPEGAGRAPQDLAATLQAAVNAHKGKGTPPAATARKRTSRKAA
jgi:DNA end-binding protein Ku